MSIAPLPGLPLALAFAAAGLLLGLLHFGLLRWNTRLYLSGRHAAAGVQLLRLALSAAGFVLIARSAGAWPLLLALAGFLLARGVLLWRERPA